MDPDLLILDAEDMKIAGCSREQTVIMPRGYFVYFFKAIIRKKDLNEAYFGNLT